MARSEDTSGPQLQQQLQGEQQLHLLLALLLRIRHRPGGRRRPHSPEEGLALWAFRPMGRNTCCKRALPRLALEIR